MTDVVLGVRLTGDGRDLVGAVDSSAASFDRLERETTQAGRAARRASNDNRELERRQRALTASSGRLGTAIKGIGIAALLTGVVAVGREIISTSSEFEQLRLRLQTVSGSAGLAAIQFETIKELARTTPFEVENLVAAFTKLQAAGIDPTEERLVSFGNTAAAFGRDITEFADAVVGAVTGETERLKAFGVIARIEGDKVALNFRGRTTQVTRDADSIVNALTQIGATEFAGGMERQARSLAGASSNAADAVSELFDAIGRAGATVAATKAVRAFTDAVETFRGRFFPTLKEELAVVDQRIKDTTADIKLLEDSLGQRLLRPLSLASNRTILQADIKRRAEILPQLKAQAEEESRILEEERKRQLAAELARTLERLRLQREDFKERRSAAQDHLQEIHEDQLAAQGRDIELLDARRDRELSELKALHEEKLISEAEFQAAREELREAFEASAFEEALEREEERRAEFESQEEERQSERQEALNEVGAAFEALERERTAGHLAQLLVAFRENSEAISEIWASGWQGRAVIASKVLGAIGSLMDRESKKQFKIWKALAIAQAIVDTAAGAMAAYKAMAGIPIIGPALGAAAAAAVIALGAVQVAKIASTKFEGGGSTGGGGGGVSAGGGGQLRIGGTGAGNEQLVQGRQVNLTIQSETGFVSVAWVRDELGPALVEAIGDGGFGLNIVTDGQ